MDVILGLLHETVLCWWSSLGNRHPTSQRKIVKAIVIAGLRSALSNLIVLPTKTYSAFKAWQ
jgi:hypothetical protein